MSTTSSSDLSAGRAGLASISPGVLAGRSTDEDLDDLVRSLLHARTLHRIPRSSYHDYVYSRIGFARITEIFSLTFLIQLCHVLGARFFTQ